MHFPPDVRTDLLSQWAEIVGPERLWLAPRLSPGDEFPTEFLPLADTFLVDAYARDKFGGTGKTADWERFARWKKDHPEKKWALAGGIGPGNLQAALDRAEPDVVDVNSSVETEPGLKDPDKLLKLRAFFDQRLPG